MPQKDVKNCYHTSQIFWDMPVRYGITICPRERSEGDLTLDFIVLLFSIFLIGNWWAGGPFFPLYWVLIGSITGPPMMQDIGRRDLRIAFVD